MTNPLSLLGSITGKKRLTINQAALYFVIPVGILAILALMRSNNRWKSEVEQIVGIRRHIDKSIKVLTPLGNQEVADFDSYSKLILAIPIPSHDDRLKDCIGIARKIALIGWTEISSGQDMVHAIELGRFSAFAALDATIEKNENYKKQPKDYSGSKWGFMARLRLFTERAEQNGLLEKLSSASGYTIEELRDSVITDLAFSRNITGHCKPHNEHTKTRSSHIDLRPFHLVSSIISELRQCPPLTNPP